MQLPAGGCIFADAYTNCLMKPDGKENSVKETREGCLSRLICFILSNLFDKMKMQLPFGSCIFVLFMF